MSVLLQVPSMGVLCWSRSRWWPGLPERRHGLPGSRKVCSFIHPSFHSSIRSFVYSFVHSFMYSHILAFMPVLSQHALCVCNCASNSQLCACHKVFKLVKTNCHKQRSRWLSTVGSFDATLTSSLSYDNFFMSCHQLLCVHLCGPCKLAA